MHTLSIEYNFYSHNCSCFLFADFLISIFYFSAIQDITSCSPRINQRNIKKPAAPPPPAQRSANCDKIVNDCFPSGELIDFSGDGVASTEKPCDTPVKSEKPNNQPAVETERSSVISLSRRKSNESFNKNELVNVLKTEKPTIPDKQAVYSSCSLDRRNHRQYSSAKGDKIPECMVRSHIERPTVPPPERPAKPPKFCSSENISANNAAKGDVEEASLQPHIKSCPLTPDKVIADGQQDNTIPATNIVKADQSPPCLQHSRSSTKINRFDFLVNQTNDKPPERPPRSNVDHSERTPCIPETPEKNSSQNVPNVSLPESASQPVIAPPPVSPRSPRLSEGEKVKPPRPQPPVPAKPKFNTTNENTSL